MHANTVGEHYTSDETGTSLPRRKRARPTNTDLLKSWLGKRHSFGG